MTGIKAPRANDPKLSPDELSFPIASVPVDSGPFAVLLFAAG
jgi:hypothetical protein